MVDTLVFVSFDLECPHNKQLNRDLRTVAEYQRMDDDTFLLLGLRCELLEGGPCTGNSNCPQLKKLPSTLLPEDLIKQDFYLCFASYEEDENAPGRIKAVADCKEQFRLSKEKKGA